MKARRIVVVLALASVAACSSRCSPKASPPTVPTFAGPASSSAVAACSALARVECAEGQDAQCALVLDRRNIAKVLPVDLAAASSATSKSDARAAGVACP